MNKHTSPPECLVTSPGGWDLEVFVDGMAVECVSYQISHTEEDRS